MNHFLISGTELILTAPALVMTKWKACFVVKAFKIIHFSFEERGKEVAQETFREGFI